MFVIPSVSLWQSSICCHPDKGNLDKCPFCNLYVARGNIYSITSAGVPTNAPTTPAAIPSPAFVAKPGGLPSGLKTNDSTLLLQQTQQRFRKPQPAHRVKQPCVNSKPSGCISGLSQQSSRKSGIHARNALFHHNGPNGMQSVPVLFCLATLTTQLHSVFN